MSSKKVHWRDIQQKTFTRWVNDHVNRKGLKCEDLQTDLQDGIVLIKLLEVVTGKKLGVKYNKHPRIEIQKRENITMALKFMKDENIPLVNVGTDDIFSGNLKIIMGMIWVLIMQFEIRMGEEEKDAMNALLEWVNSKIGPEYKVKNFGKSWNSGKAVCALTNALVGAEVIPNSDVGAMKRSGGEANCGLGIDNAFTNLGVDKLVMADEMSNPKVDKLAMMCYVAQFRNIPEDILSAAKEKNKIPEHTLCRAYGDGIVEGVVGVESEFCISCPEKMEGKLEVKVVGPSDDIDVKVKTNKDGTREVSYTPTEAGEYEVHVTVDGEHIPGSVFMVLVLEDECLGGEGMIRVFYSTTSSSEKYKRDKRGLEKLLQAKKVHLRDDFEPWHAVDLMNADDRNKVFKKAGTRTLPIIFIDDEYVGDYDKMQEYEENGELDELLAMKGKDMISEEEHLERLKRSSTSPKPGQLDLDEKKN